MMAPCIGLRDRISHNWLDNTLLPEDTQTMLARWKGGQAGVFLLACETYEAKALDLAGRLREFSASTLVPLLPGLDYLGEEGRSRLCARLDEIYAGQVDVDALGTRYRQAMGSLSAALGAFRALLSCAESPAPEAVGSAWDAVRQHALEFKAVIDDVPKGVVLP